MDSRNVRNQKKHKGLVFFVLSFLALALVFMAWYIPQHKTSKSTISVQETHSSSVKNNSSKAKIEEEVVYEPSQEEKDYLSQKFSNLTAINSEAIGYIYAPGTQLDEPIAQTTDNYTYLTKTFDGQNIPYLGSVFMDPNNAKDFSDRLTWLFGHARGSTVPDHRMFNDVNFYSDQTYFNEHPYVVIETPQRKYYYEAVAMIVVPETTAFYRTSFDNADDFKEQLETVYHDASVKNSQIKVNPKDKYMVLSTCREEDPTLRANLYLRQIPDKEMATFIAEHQEQLKYVPTR